MMAKIFRVNKKKSLIGAINLGIAMQLTNIARDVIEDKKRNRAGRKLRLHHSDAILDDVLLCLGSGSAECCALGPFPLNPRVSPPCRNYFPTTRAAASQNETPEDPKKCLKWGSGKFYVYVSFVIKKLRCRT